MHVFLLILMILISLQSARGDKTLPSGNQGACDLGRVTTVLCPENREVYGIPECEIWGPSWSRSAYVKRCHCFAKSTVPNPWPPMTCAEGGVTPYKPDVECKNTSPTTIEDIPWWSNPKSEVFVHSKTEAETKQICENSPFNREGCSFECREGTTPRTFMMCCL